MAVGRVVANRFEILEKAGSGSMGRVYRALDRESGEMVALKLLGDNAEHADRFSREADVLADVNHPGIVRYVAHGAELEGDRYLAMEWIEGETLAHRMARSPLTLDEAIALGTRIADALAALHRNAIIHRDLKPSNVVVPQGQVARAKLVDFGVARRQGDRDALTQPGTIVGTPGFMAPEQVRGEPDVDVRADVFALGALLFKCIAGRAAFEGGDALTVLLKVILEEPPQLLDVCPTAPIALAELVDDMLAKSREHRPKDAADVLERLAMLDGRPPRTSVPPPALTGAERQIVCLVLARVGRRRLAASLFGARERDGADEKENLSLREVIDQHGGRLDLLADGSALVVLTGDKTPTDLAGRAARCALGMRTALEGAPMAVVSGRAVVTRRSPVSEAIDRGVSLLSYSEGDSIRLDAVTAGLLDARFELGGDDHGLTLAGERDAGGSRTLLGKPTNIVGRDQELAILKAVFGACADEPSARAVLVTGAAGIGKSRLRHELVRNIARSDARTQIWIGRADPMNAGSAFALLGSAIKNGLGLEGSSAPIRARKLAARVGSHFEGEDAVRVTEFVGEMIGVESDAQPSVQLRGARKDPTRMGEQMKRAFEDLLRAECAEAPIVLVLDDLHWGDLPTVRFVDSALKTLAELPFMVLALARPDALDIFPKLWSDRNTQVVNLGGLTKKASEKLARQVLGASAAPETVRLIVDRAGGNAFYLEELIRSVAEGKGDALPETILSMAAARLERLEPEARRVLRAASIFGQEFSRTGVAVLLGERSAKDRSARATASETNAWLDTLVASEVIARRPTPGRDGDPDLVFRHSLVREAAYTMLTDADRTLGHKLAAEWLESVGQKDAIALAEHWKRGGAPERAIVWYLRGAEQALEGNDFAAALAGVAHAIELGPQDDTHGALVLAKAEAHRWRGELADAEAAATLAMARLPRGSDAWYRAARELAISTATHGRHDRLVELAAELTKEAPNQGASGMYAVVSAGVAVRLHYSGRPELADTLFRRLEEMEAEDDPSVLAEVHQARGYRAHAEGDLSALLRSATLSEQSFLRAGEPRNAVQQRVNAGYASLEIGDHEAAEVLLRGSLEDAVKLGLPAVIALAKHNLGLALARRGAHEEACTLEREAASSAVGQGHVRMECGARLYLALILAEARSLDAAECEARAALEASAAAPLLRPKAHAALARVKLLKGSIDEALSAAREAQAALDEIGTIEEGEPLVRLVYAEALHAAGHAALATAAISIARERLEVRAAKIGDTRHRDSFLTRVPENARTLELATAWTSA